MDNYRELTPADFDPFFSLMEKTFPPAERRTREKAFQLLTAAPCYHALGFYDSGERLEAFIAYWLFEESCFVEHLAVEENLRNQGIGSEIMRHVMAHVADNLVLEVEPPGDEMAEKRIRFYERLGFHLNDFPYKQPSMQPGEPEVPMKIMSYPAQLTPQSFDTIRQRIFHHCYNKIQRNKGDDSFRNFPEK